MRNKPNSKNKSHLKSSGCRWLMSILIVFFTQLDLSGQTTESVLQGQVTEVRTGTPLTGALILIEENGSSEISDKDGKFSFVIAKGDYTLKISFIGLKTITRKVSHPQSEPLKFAMEDDELALGEVEVLSTGYQEIPRERATGSFVQLNRQLIDRRVSTNILERIEDVSSGVIFNRNASSTEPLSIRGRSTLFGNTQPLIVIDNLPYEGNIDHINPNDVESITLLKDAAAASIWGAQAGNGVIVIKTKTGRYNRPPEVAFQSNLTVEEKLDLLYQPQMDMADFIAQERKLFNSGFYNSRINSVAHQTVPPVVEALLAAREGRITDEDAEALLAQYAATDSRIDLMRNYYRPAVRQQYAFQISGGGNAHHYNLSGGYDHNLAGQIGNKDNRITLNARQTWKLAQDRLEVSSGLYLTRGERSSDTAVPSPYVYESLADKEGNALPITANLSTRYLDEVENRGLLDWRLIPLSEIGKRNDRTVSTDIRFNLDLKYRILSGLELQTQYQYWQNATETRNIETEELWGVRNLINSYTQIGNDGGLLRPVPRGGRFTNLHAQSRSHNIRTTLNYSLHRDSNRINALFGAEVRDLSRLTDRMVYYGYNDHLGLGVPVDFITRFPQYFNPGASLVIPYGGSHSGLTDRYISYFGNIGYTFRDKYLVTVSARKDMSNLFGVETNQRGVPLWSTGIGWIVSEEKFYDSEWIPFLKLRLSYGYNGNVDKSLTAFTTIEYTSFHDYIPGLRNAYITNPPNPNLRWEKIRIVNAAMDFETRSGRIGGSVELYSKNGQDLIGETQVPDSNGIYQFRGNFASTITRGFDFTLNIINIDKQLRWSSQWLLSGWKERVTEFGGVRTTAQMFTSGSSSLVPVQGNPLFAVYSLPWAGLDPANGNPLGYLDGEVSDDYPAILAAVNPQNIQLHGSARPTVFGSLRNTFDWKGWNLSFNISYRLGYYYRRATVSYSALSSGEISHPDYGKRWQRPGDELHTQVPSEPGGLDLQRQSFYGRSSFLIERGDHLRFQDIRLGRSWSNASHPRLPFRSLEAFIYLNNLGLIWKATSDTQDPDFRTLKPQRSSSLGLRINL